MAAPQLLETDRQKLDGIVERMIANGESDDDIQFVVNDFKQKYAKSQPAYRGMGELRARDQSDRLEPARVAARAAQKAGFRGDALRTAIAVAMAESGGNPRAANRTAPDDSHGLWQVNYFGNLAKERTKKFGNQQAQYDPATNARAAYAISGGGKNWRPWTTFTSGKHKQYLGLADQVARELEVPTFGATVGASTGASTQPPIDAAKLLGGTHVGAQPVKPKPKEKPQTLSDIAAKMPELEQKRREQEAKRATDYYESSPYPGKETGIGNEAQIEAEIRAKGRANLSDPYGKVSEMVGKPLQAAIGKHIRNISLGTSPISRLMDVVMPGASQDQKDEAVGTWVGVPENVDQAAIMAAIPLAGKAAGFGMKWLDDLVKAAETRAQTAIQALGAKDVVEQVTKAEAGPIFIPKEDVNYPQTMQGVDPLGLAKLGENPAPVPEVPQAPKPASTGLVEPKKGKGVSNATKPKTTEVPTKGVLGEKGPEVGLPQAGKGAGKGGAQTQKAQSKIKAKLADASAERQSAWEALQKSRKATKRSSKQSGAVQPITPEEIAYFKSWVKEKGWQAASSAEDFVKHMVELGEEAAHWRRVAKAHAPVERAGQAGQNASTSAIRAKTGLGSFPNVDKQTMASWVADAKAKGFTTRDGSERLVKLHEIGEKPTFNASETVGLASRLDELDKQYNRAQSLLHSAIGTSREEAAYASSQKIADEIDRITNALNKAGTQQGRDFVARRAMVKDRSFVGLYSEYRKAVGRKLTETETKNIQGLANEFSVVEKKAIAAAKKRATEKASELDRIARGEVSAIFQRRKRVPVSDAEFKVRAKAIAGDAARVFQAHSAKFRGSMLGGDIAPEIASLAKELAPHIKAYSQLVFDHGVTKVQDNLAEVARFLKANKIEGIEENEVAAVLTGRLRQQSEKPAQTAWQAFTEEVNTLFKTGKSEIDEQRRFVEQKAKEAKQAARKEMRDTDMAKLREERDAVLAEEKARKDYEKAFWQEVKWWQAGFNEKKMAAARLERQEAKKRWMASAAGRRAQILNRIDTLEKRMEVFKQSGIIQGQKSKLPIVTDPLAREIQIKETALRNRWHKIVNEAKRSAEESKLRNSGRLDDQAKLILGDTYSGVREMIATFDDSFPFNQGGMALFSDPKSWMHGFKRSLQSFSEKGFQAVQDEVAAHPRFQQAEAANLFEGGLEDVFGKSRISDKPWYKPFEQAYEGAGVALRLDLFDRWASIMETTGRPLDVEALTKLADEVKTWTGLGSWGKNAGRLGKLFFALRYRMSQAEILLGAPLVRSMIEWRATGNPALFKVMTRSYAKALGTMAVTTLAINRGLEEVRKLGGDWAKDTYIETDTTSTNYGRLVVNGKATLQIYPPFTRLLMLGSRLGQGAYKTEAGIKRQTSEFTSQDRRSLLFNYISTGLHPLPGFVVRSLDASDRKDLMSFDQSFDFTKPEAYEDMLKSFLPISVQGSLHLWFDDEMTEPEKIIGTLVNFFVPVSPIRKPGPSSKSKPKGSAPAKATKPPAGAKIPSGAR